MTEPKKRILYAGNFRLNPPDAAGKRVLELSHGFAKLGHIVDLLPMNAPLNCALAFNSANPFSEELINDNMSYWQILSAVTKSIKKQDYSHVILYNPSAGLSLVTLLRSFKGRFSVILDCTEWYEAEHLSSFAAKAEVFTRMRCLYPMFRRSIAISPFLERYLSHKQSIVIPPLVRASELVQGNSDRDFLSDGKLKICYAGFPGSKDRIDLLATSLDNIAASLPFKVELHLAGPDESELADLFSSLGGHLSVHAHGRLTRHAIMDMYRTSQLSAVFRNDARYEKAGFPTKAVESWSQAVPVIVLNHSVFAAIGREYGAVIDVDSANIEGAMIELLTDLYFHPATYNRLRAGALKLANEQHVVDRYLPNLSVLL